MLRLGLSLALVALILAGPVAPLRADEVAEKAKRHNAAARAFFHLGKFKQAVEEYEKAYRAKPIPVFLYNLGQCHKRLGSTEHLKKALFFFEGYLNAAPDAPNRRGVEATIARLRQQIEEQRRAQQEQPKSKQPVVKRQLETSEPRKPGVKPLVLRPRPLTKPTPRAARPTPFYRRWWFWTVVGAVIVGGTVAVAVTTGGEDWVPRGADGCFTPSAACE